MHSFKNSAKNGEKIVFPNFRRWEKNQDQFGIWVQEQPATWVQDRFATWLHDHFGIWIEDHFGTSMQDHFGKWWTVWYGCFDTQICCCLIFRWKTNWQLGAGPICHLIAGPIRHSSAEIHKKTLTILDTMSITIAWENGKQIGLSGIE